MNSVYFVKEQQLKFTGLDLYSKNNTFPNPLPSSVEISSPTIENKTINLIEPLNSIIALDPSFIFWGFQGNSYGIFPITFNPLVYLYFNKEILEEDVPNGYFAIPEENSNKHIYIKLVSVPDGTIINGSSIALFDAITYLPILLFGVSTIFRPYLALDTSLEENKNLFIIPNEYFGIPEDELNTSYAVLPGDSYIKINTSYAYNEITAFNPVKTSPVLILESDERTGPDIQQFYNNFPDSTNLYGIFIEFYLHDDSSPDNPYIRIDKTDSFLYFNKDILGKLFSIVNSEFIP